MAMLAVGAALLLVARATGSMVLLGASITACLLALAALALAVVFHQRSSRTLGDDRSVVRPQAEA